MLYCIEKIQLCGLSDRILSRKMCCVTGERENNMSQVIQGYKKHTIFF